MAVNSHLSNMKFLCILVTTALVIASACCTEFDVIPGGQRHEMIEKSGDVACKFTYVCQGGTKEKWEINIKEQDNLNSLCQINRPDGKSYLFFQEFNVDVAGARIVDAMIFKNGPKEAGESQFKVDRKANKVSQGDKFKNELSGIEVLISSEKEEL